MRANTADGRGVTGGLARAALGLVRTTARMSRLEAREVLPRLGRRVALLLASAALGAAGLVAVLGGLGLLAEDALRMPRWAAFTAVGGSAVALGIAGAWVAIRRLGSGDLAFPETVAELSKDFDAFDRQETAR